jgi:7,8-dihydro-6-hydroxymethylpterin dimethyltransferase
MQNYSNPMTPSEIKSFKTYGLVGPESMEGALHRARTRVQDVNLWAENQTLGRRYPIGCVALEVTQRCNLDCSLCYLSENSESVKDIPIEEVFRRIDQIRNHYGLNTDVQITGGDPTLRKREELVAIVKRVRSLGLRPTLMTNGIKATRDLMVELCDAGLGDVAFHVDLTQERKGYQTEADLNELRLKYIERVRGLPLSVIFNTTVFKGNFHQIPDLIRFFRKHTDVVGFASFQLQADTGRGVLRKRDDLISVETVMDKIREGAETKLSFGSVQIGHQECNRYSNSLAVNGNLYDFMEDKEFISKALQATASDQINRVSSAKTAMHFAKVALKNPNLLALGLKAYGPKLWQMKRDLIAAQGKVKKLSIFIHNFMDACQLDPERIHACSFMVMTGQGPISMCMHNAKRDEFILQPVKIDDGLKIWNPLTGNAEESEKQPFSSTVQAPLAEELTV